MQKEKKLKKMGKTPVGGDEGKGDDSNEENEGGSSDESDYESENDDIGLWRKGKQD